MWKTIKERLGVSENANIVKAFINPLRAIKESDEELVIGCPSQQIVTLLEKQHLDKKITELAREIIAPGITVRFIVKKLADLEDIQPLLPLSEAQATASEGKRSKQQRSTFVSSEYTFNTFVSGPSNKDVYESALYVAKHPGTNRNPLVIYGGTGLGKTHLLQAIGNFAASKNKNFCYISTQKLINEFYKAMTENSMQKFHDTIMAYDFLLVDDIQFMKTPGIQEEFFRMFNEYHHAKKQIVITSDRYPGEIREIDNRLKSRFDGGVTIEIRPPELDTRIAIVHKKAELYEMRVEDDAIFFIAKNFKNNVRQIEGALKTLQISAEIVGRKEITKEFATDRLRDMIRVKTNITMDDIIKMTATVMGVKVSDILSKERSKQVSLSRQIAMFLSKKYTSSTLVDIGERFSGRNHATVISSITRIEKLFMDDINIKKIVEKLEREIEDMKY